MTDVMAVQIVQAPNDGNGNFPRLLLVYSSVGNVVDIITIDYGNIPEPYKGATRLPGMKLTAKDFKGWLDLRKERDNALSTSKEQ